MLMSTRAYKLALLLDELQDRLERPLFIVETGTIRDKRPQYEVGDGHSTRVIAEWIKERGRHPHMFWSVDLNVAVADEYLRELKLKSKVKLVKGNSLDILPDIERTIDLLYLDSDNDDQLILQEFISVEDNLEAGSSIVVVDDVSLNSAELHKGKKVVPYARSKGYSVTIEGIQAIIRV